MNISIFQLEKSQKNKIRHTKKPVRGKLTGLWLKTFNFEIP